jgi:hypothetical protein
MTDMKRRELGRQVTELKTYLTLAYFKLRESESSMCGKDFLTFL